MEGTLDTGDQHRPYWRSFGNPNGAPLLLLHGGYGHVFDPGRLEGIDQDRWKIVLLHQRGVGLSQPYGETDRNTITDNILDIERLRAHLDIKQWSVLAWSFGAVLAAGYGFRFPGRVKHLTCYAPYLGSDEDYQATFAKSPELARKYTALHGTGTGKGIVTSIFNKAAAGDDATRFRAYAAAMRLWDESLTDDTIRKGFGPGEWESICRMRRIGASLDRELFNGHDRFLLRLAEKPGAIKTPATLIYGEQDNWSVPNLYARSVFNDAAIMTVPGAGHDIHQPAVQECLRKALKYDPGRAFPEAGTSCRLDV